MKLLVFSFFLSLAFYGQLPKSEIWLFQLTKKNNQLTYSKPLNITNNVGYNNQPCFSSDGKFIYYARTGNLNQVDIYKYEVLKKITINLTNSEVSEYSPNLLPEGSGFSSVVVEKDSAQRIWQFQIDGTFFKILHEQTDSIGYYCWLNSDTLLYYKLTKPHSLRCLNVKTNEDVWICNDPSRSFKKIANTSQFIYAIKDSTGLQFRIYNIVLRKSTSYAFRFGLHEDFIWHDEFGLVKSEGASLIRYNEIKGTWEELISFAHLGINNITRFVFDKNTKQLALVNDL